MNFATIIIYGVGLWLLVGNFVAIAVIQDVMTTIVMEERRQRISPEYQKMFRVTSLIVSLVIIILLWPIQVFGQSED